GQAFSFPLARRRGDTPELHLDLAAAWLAGALTHLGAGAKTATGYGAFRLEDTGTSVRDAVVTAWEGAQGKGTRAECTATLELTPPAFLGGAGRGRGDCELRPATLRGQLRWWWRPLHAGFLDVKPLARLEAAVWGDTASGAAVRLTVEPVTPL